MIGMQRDLRTTTEIGVAAARSDVSDLPEPTKLKPPIM